MEAPSFHSLPPLSAICRAQPPTYRATCTSTGSYTIKSTRSLLPQRYLPVNHLCRIRTSCGTSLTRWKSCDSTLPKKLDPPNDEVNWVVVDVTTEDLAQEKIPPDMLDSLHNDAKSLVRVALQDAPVELSVLFCSDESIRSLNAQWRGKDTATDVLSFPQNDPDQVVLGDIIVSVDTAAAQADERQLSLTDEIRVLLVHGLLHLLGYDHEGATDGDWLVMAQMENRFLKDLGWNGQGLVTGTLDQPYRNIVQPSS